MAVQMKWSKGFLYTTWVIRLIIVLIITGIAARNYSYYANYYNSRYKLRYNPDFYAFSITIGFTVTTIILDVLEIILFNVHKFHPVFFLVANIIKMAIWTTYFVFSVIDAALLGYFSASMIVAILLFVLCQSAFVYGCMMVHRWRKERSYTGVGKHAMQYDMQQGNTEYSSHPAALA